MKIGSSQWEFMLSSVRVTEGKITVNVLDGNPRQIDFGSSQGEVRVSKCSSYRESTVLNFKEEEEEEEEYFIYPQLSHQAYL